MLTRAHTALLVCFSVFVARVGVVWRCCVVVCACRVAVVLSLLCVPTPGRSSFAKFALCTFAAQFRDTLTRLACITRVRECMHVVGARHYWRWRCVVCARAALDVQICVLYFPVVRLLRLQRVATPARRFVHVHGRTSLWFWECMCVVNRAASCATAF